MKTSKNNSVLALSVLLACALSFVAASSPDSAFWAYYKKAGLFAFRDSLCKHRVPLDVKHSHPGTLERHKFIKGIELYSWNEKSGWHYSILMGTNRYKTIDEIRQAAIGLDTLLLTIDCLSRFDNIFWLWGARLATFLSLPPDSIVTVVRERCRRASVRLEMPDYEAGRGTER